MPLPVYLWASLGAPDDPPRRVQVETCTTCAALVPLVEFDRHGHWHREIER
jgi:hypothetical protein